MSKRDRISQAAQFDEKLLLEKKENDVIKLYELRWRKLGSEFLRNSFFFEKSVESAP